MIQSLNLFMMFLFSYTMTDMFQPHWLRTEKKTYWLYLVQHSMVDGLIIYMLTRSIPLFLIISITHYIIDLWQIDNKNRIPDRLGHVAVWIILSMKGLL